MLVSKPLHSKVVAHRSRLPLHLTVRTRGRLVRGKGGA